MVILERRNNAGKIAYKTLEDAWQGSNEDNFILLDLLDQLRTDPGLLSSETVLADLNDELAPVSARPFQLPNSCVTFLDGYGIIYILKYQGKTLKSFLAQGRKSLWHAPKPIQTGVLFKGWESCLGSGQQFCHLLFSFLFFNRCSLSDGSIPCWTISRTAGTVCFTVTGTDWVLMSLDREQDLLLPCSDL